MVGIPFRILLEFFCYNFVMNKLTPKIILEGARLFELQRYHIADWMESTGGLYMS
jgi:hypothetical protein